MHKSQLFFIILIGILAGIFAASFFPLGPALTYGGLILGVLFLAVFGYHKNYNEVGFAVGVILIAFLIGAIRMDSAEAGHGRLDTFVGREAKQQGVPVMVIGYIGREPEQDGGRQEFVLKAKMVVAGNRIISVNDNVLVYADTFPKFKYGDALALNGALEKPENLNDFDYVSYLKKEGIRTLMYQPEIKTRENREIGWFEELKVETYAKLFAVKEAFSKSLGRAIPEPNAAFTQGILLGARQDLPEDLKADFNKTGVTHILAVSGFNIMIIVTALTAFLTLFWRRKTAFWASAAGIIAFVVLTGASASVIRAGIMGLLLAFAAGYGRLYSQRNSIALAATAMALINPYVLRYDVGFQLSFAAVLGLAYLYPYLSEKIGLQPDRFGFKEAALMTASAQLAVLPVLLHHFKFFSLVSLPANILILPFVPLAMLSGFAAGLAGLIAPPLGQVLGWITWAITTYQLEIVRLFANI